MDVIPLTSHLLKFYVEAFFIPRHVNVDPPRQFVHVANFASNDIPIYSIGVYTGELHDWKQSRPVKTPPPS